MKIKPVILFLLIILISIAAISYWYYRFSGTFYRSVSSAMVHDSTTEVVYYQWLENNLNYSRSYIDSWPIKNGYKIGDTLQIESITCNEIEVGDVILYTPVQDMNPIAHRVIKINPDNTFMTKGDHNPVLLQFENSITCNKILGRVINVI